MAAKVVDGRSMSTHVLMRGNHYAITKMTQMSVCITIWCSCCVSLLEYSQPCGKCEPSSLRATSSSTTKLPEHLRGLGGIVTHPGVLGDAVKIFKESNTEPYTLFLAWYKSSWPALAKLENLTVDMWKPGEQVNINMEIYYTGKEEHK